MNVEKIYRINDIDIFYDTKIEHNSLTWGLDYLDVLKTRYKDHKFQNVLDWCAGFGMSGLSLLAENYCHKISLNDCYPEAIELLNKTKRQNPTYSDLIIIYKGSTLKRIPANEQFDLIIGAPPYLSFNPNPKKIKGYKATQTVDFMWETHRAFFRDVKQHLAHNGVLILQENTEGSSQTGEEFLEYLKDADLKIVNIYCSNNFSTVYYIEIAHNVDYTETIVKHDPPIIKI